jgi:inorganic pyrophosphatase
MAATSPRLTLRSSFYHSEILWNYGYIPQTIEDPEAKDALTGELGDGDPVDVVEIGAAARDIGSIREVCSSLSVY